MPDDLRSALARLLSRSGASGRLGASQPGRAGSVVTGPGIHAAGTTASVGLVGESNTDSLTLSADGGAPVKLIFEHPPLGFIATEIDLDITPRASLQPGQPASSDQVWIELGGVQFDRAVFTPANAASTDPAAPVVGSLALLQGDTLVYSLTDVHAGHYGMAGGGQFSVGVDPQSGYDCVAYGPA